jgi:short-subunit dehydrogenase
VDKAVAALKVLEATAGGQVHGIKCDVGSAEDVERLRLFAQEKLGVVHIWLNNAGQVSIEPAVAATEDHAGVCGGIRKFQEWFAEDS